MVDEVARDPGHVPPVPGPGGDAAWQPPTAVLDPARLAAVRATGLLDSAASESLDRLTSLAARLLRAPLAFLTVVDERRSYWVSCTGEAAGSVDAGENTVEQSFCRYVIEDVEPFVVGDAARHPRTRDNPSVAAMGVRAWAGYPLLDAAGHALGSFCVVDTVPRKWTDDDVDLLGVLARAASAQVSLIGLVKDERDARDEALRRRAAEERAETRLARLADVALLLTSAGTVDDLTRIVIGHGLPVLGADGGAVCVRDDEAGVVRVAESPSRGERVRLEFRELPLDSRLPAAHAARAGEPVLLPDRAAGFAWSPDIDGMYRATRPGAWACVPLQVGDRLLGSLVVSWAQERRFPPEEVALLNAVAAQCAQSLDRIQTAMVEKQTALAVQRLSEALQRSLLTQPPAPEHLDLAVRYQPAAQEAQVGGDWYDAFVTASGSTTVVVGDVNGHDRTAAASMGQIRNLLRGLAYDSADGPAALLSRLDLALRGLQLDTLATVVLASIEQDAGDPSTGPRRLHWSNAGHPPPMLRERCGTVRVLGEDGDLLLGVDPTTDRVEHVVDLPDGATVLLYTDGLVEHRGSSIDEGIGRLREVFSEVGGLEPDVVCDAVLEACGVADNEDDVALLVLRANPRSA